MGNSSSKKETTPPDEVAKPAAENSVSETDIPDTEDEKKKIRFSLPPEKEKLNDEIHTKPRASVFDVSSVLASDKTAELQLPDLLSKASNNASSVSRRHSIEKHSASTSPAKTAVKRKPTSPIKSNSPAKKIELKTTKQNKSPVTKPISPTKMYAIKKTVSPSKVSPLKKPFSPSKIYPLKKSASPSKMSPQKKHISTSPIKKNSVIDKKSVGTPKVKILKSKLKSTVFNFKGAQGLKEGLKLCKPCVVVLDARMVEQYLKKMKTVVRKTSPVKKTSPSKVQKLSPSKPKVPKGLDGSAILSPRTKRSPSKAKINYIEC